MSNMDISKPICESYWVISDHFRAGEYPGAATDEEIRLNLGWLLEGGANLFIDLAELGEAGLHPYDQFLVEESLLSSKAAMYKRIPLRDFDTPPVEMMVEILDTIDLALSLGKNIYLHCHGGKGRTGTVVGCYLVRHGLEGSEALERIQELRKDIQGSANKSPETEGQIRMVLKWKKEQ
jgi:Polymorphic toxin system, DSP-PTPase phosphatase